MSLPGKTLVYCQVMQALRLSLFGMLRVERGNQEVTNLSRSAKGLLARLALTSTQQSRLLLAGWLWPESPEETGRYNLRRTLSELRNALGEDAACLLTPTRETLALEKTMLWCDVWEFDAAIAKKDYTRAIELHIAPLLEAEYDDFWAHQRTRRHEQYCDAGQKRDGAVETGRVITRPTQTSSLLPVLITPLVGREHDTNQVLERLKKSRLVTLAGPGGIGKTSLSLEVAHTLVNQYPDGVYFVELAPLGRSEDIPLALCQTFDLVLESESDPTIILQEHLCTKTVLLLLDNCEHLIESVATWCKMLLTYCEGLHILATSREPLGVPGERVWRVNPLTQDAAEQLFKERAESESEENISTEQNIGTEQSINTEQNIIVAQICHLLDGLPLAIEMVAMRARVLPLDNLQNLLQKQLLFLRQLDKDSLPHHATLWTTFEWSYCLLPKKMQNVFLTLSLFASSFSLDMALEIGLCDADTLFSLVNKSFLVRENDRYRMLVPLRQFAQEKALPSDSKERYVAYFLGWVESKTTTLPEHEQDKVISREIDNLRVALQMPTEASLRLAIASLVLWRSPSFVNEGLEILGRLCTPETPQKLQAWAQYSLGVLYNVLGRMNDAKKAFAQATTYAQAENDAKCLAYIGFRMASVCIKEYQYVEAERFLLDGIAYFSATNNTFYEANCLQDLGYCYRDWHNPNRDLDKATECIEKARKLYLQIGEMRHERSAYSHLAIIALARKDLVTGVQILKEILHSCKEFGYSDGVIWTLTSLGAGTRDMGQFDESQAYLEEALALGRLHMGKNVVWLLLELGRTAQAMDDITAAKTHYTACRDLARTKGDADFVKQATDLLAELGMAPPPQ
jgi:predicted ATPase